jgi:hypothetical protein
MCSEPIFGAPSATSTQARVTYNNFIFYALSLYCSALCLYVCMGMYVNVWVCMGMYVYVCVCMSMYVYVCMNAGKQDVWVYECALVTSDEESPPPKALHIIYILTKGKSYYR